MSTHFEINERTTTPYTGTIKDSDGVVVPLAAVSSIKMTLIDEATGEVLNERNGQNVLNNNDCTLHVTSGLFTWDIQTEDTMIIGETKPNDVETHLATLTVVLTNGVVFHHEIRLDVKNLRSVPQTA